MKTRKKSKLLLGNVVFVVVCAGILIFLLNAPKETTTPLPHDDLHKHFYDIKDKKEAEKFCLECHDQDRQAPLPENHPPKYRCLFCHKRI